MFEWNAMQTPPSHQANVGGEVMPDEFGTEPLQGYRGWYVVNAGDGAGFALRSLHAGHIWSPQVEAVCLQSLTVFYRGPDGAHVSPDPACSCGIYAQLPEQPLTEWDRMKQGRVTASGTIDMWGRIIQCERGYKAQYAEIQAPVVIDMSCVKGCDRSPTRVALPDHAQAVFHAYCEEHKHLSAHPVTVDAKFWMPVVTASLAKRYDIEVFSWL